MPPHQVPVMIYPEPGLADQYWIPWWIILIAVLAGILLLTLLVCILWKVIYMLTHTHVQYQSSASSSQIKCNKSSCPVYFFQVLCSVNFIITLDF